MPQLVHKLTKRVSFSASHYYWQPNWSEEKNQLFFGLCSNLKGHGHNYQVEVCIQALPNEATGMILNFDLLNPILQTQIVDVYDHKLINEQVDGFKTQIPTLENITNNIVQRLHPSIQSLDLTLVSVKVFEREDLWVEWMSNQTNSKLTKQYRFSAAHTLFNPQWDTETNINTFGDCAKLHGHTYTLEITVDGPVDSESGMLLPLTDLDHQVKTALLNKVDHCNLDTDVDFIQGHRSTVEILSQLFFEQLAPHIPHPTKLYKVKLFECPDNSAETVVQH